MARNSILIAALLGTLTGCAGEGGTIRGTVLTNDDDAARADLDEFFADGGPGLTLSTVSPLASATALTGTRPVPAARVFAQVLDRDGVLRAWDAPGHLEATADASGRFVLAYPRPADGAWTSVHLHAEAPFPGEGEPRHAGGSFQDRGPFPHAWDALLVIRARGRR